MIRAARRWWRRRTDPLERLGPMPASWLRAHGVDNRGRTSGRRVHNFAGDPPERTGWLWKDVGDGG